jgi:hypothetical protein
MLTIATYVILGVVTIIHGFIIMDEQKLHQDHHPEQIESASPQCEEGDTHQQDVNIERFI